MVKSSRRVALERVDLLSRDYPVKDLYPRLIFTMCETLDRHRQVIVSDAMAFRFQCYYFEVTFYFDVFTKGILTAKRPTDAGKSAKTDFLVPIPPQCFFVQFIYCTHPFLRGSEWHGTAVNALVRRLWSYANPM